MKNKSFIEKFKYAFSTEGPKEVFSDKEINLLKRIAAIICLREMHTPAILFLESVKPFNFIASQMMFFFNPFIQMATFDKYELELVGQILGKRQSIEVFIEIIQEFIGLDEKELKSYTKNIDKEKLNLKITRFPEDLNS